MKFAEIILVSTLHQLHNSVSGYDFKTLENLLVDLSPSAIVVELEQTQIDNAPDEIKGSKVEYNKAIFPAVKKLQIKMYPLEPSGEKRDNILGVYSNHWRAAEKDPRFSAFEIYSNTLIDHLKSTWVDAKAVNSELTIECFRMKHLFQEALFGVDTPSWFDWNKEFLKNIKKVINNYGGKRIVVTVGAEHIHWLEDELKKEKSIKLLRPHEALGAL